MTEDEIRRVIKETKAEIYKLKQLTRNRLLQREK